MSVESEARLIRVSGADGLTLAAWDYGGAGPVVCFVHGFGHDHHVWDEIAPAFVGQFRVIALDLRGHGASDRDPGFRYHHVSIGKDLGAALVALGAERVTLVAHSTAGHAAIGFAARFPECLERLVLVDAGAELRASGGGGDRGERRTRDGDGSFASVGDYVAELARHHPAAPPERLARLAAHWLRCRDDGRYEPTLDPMFWRPRVPRAGKPAGESPAGETTSARASEAEKRSVGFDRKAWAEEGEAALWRDLAAIRCPVLAVRGAESPMLSAATVERMTRESLADGRAVEIPGSGHVPMIDQPALFLAALGRFLLDSKPRA